jgi:hypothetical protein
MFSRHYGINENNQKTAKSSGKKQNISTLLDCEVGA